MNYEIEDNFDWKQEINDDNQSFDISYCLISGLPLVDGYITLPCGHQFNYYYIYSEIIKQKKYTTLEYKKLLFNQIKCPYCRTIYNNLLPYYKIDNIRKIYGVNSPESQTFKFNTCEYIYKSGKKQNCLCNKNNALTTKFGNYCNAHYKLECIKIDKQFAKNDINLLNIPQLKLILKKNNCKIGGKKSELIQRINIEKEKKGINWIE